MKKTHRTSPVVGGIYGGCGLASIFLVYGRSFNLDLSWWAWIISMLMVGIVGGAVITKWLQIIDEKQEEDSIKIKYETGEKKEAVKKVTDIPVGAVFSGTIVGNSIYLRDYEGIVDLQYPRNTWPKQTPVPIVSNYRELNAELIVSEKEE